MAYSINPNLPKARAIAMQLLIRDGLPLSVVANRCGVNRSTVWRWKQKWDKLNANIQLTNDNRPNRSVSISSFRFSACVWRIPTNSSKPHHYPLAVSEDIVRQIIATRDRLKRCAEVVWHHVTVVLGIKVSLSSVRRILRRHHYFDGARKKRIRPDNPRRPHVTRPGELVQTDTIHHVDSDSGRRLILLYRHRSIYTHDIR